MNSIKTLWIAVIVVMVIAIGGYSYPKQTVNTAKKLGAIVDTSFFDYFDATTGYKIGGTTVIDNSKGLTATGTTTISKSFDGFVAYAGFTVATGTAKAVYSNNTGTAMICDADSGFIEPIGTTFAPTLSVSIGTSTSVTGYSTGLMASTTIATTTSSIIPFTYSTPFKLATGESIVAALSDIYTTASSTYFSNWTMQFGVHCWLMGQ